MSGASVRDICCSEKTELVSVATLLRDRSVRVRQNACVAIKWAGVSSFRESMHFINYIYIIYIYIVHIRITPSFPIQQQSSPHLFPYEQSSPHLFPYEQSSPHLFPYNNNRHPDKVWGDIVQSLLHYVDLLQQLTINKTPMHIHHQTNITNI